MHFARAKKALLCAGEGSASGAVENDQVPILYGGVFQHAVAGPQDLFWPGEGLYGAKERLLEADKLVSKRKAVAIADLCNGTDSDSDLRLQRLPILVNLATPIFGAKPRRFFFFAFSYGGHG